MERTEKHPATYIMASRYRGTLYTGVTSDLWSRVAGHKTGAFAGFTATYDVKLLVWFEHHQSMDAAIKRESQIKNWKCQWKFELIEKFNRDWIDMHDHIDFCYFDPARPRG